MTAVVSWFLDRKPGVRDRCRSWGKHDAPGAAYGTAGRPPVGAGSDADVTAALPGGRAMYVVWVTLPLFKSPVPPVCPMVGCQAYLNVVLQIIPSGTRAFFSVQPGNRLFVYESKEALGLSDWQEKRSRQLGQ